MARVPRKREVIKGLLDSLSEALVVLDPALEVIEWNAAMERLSGIPRADALGRNAESTFTLFRDPAVGSLIRRLEAELERDFPGWLIAREDSGRWSASTAIWW